MPGESFCFSPVFNSRDWGRKIDNFGMDQLRDMRNTEVSFMLVNYKRAGQHCLLPLMPALPASMLPLATLAMPILMWHLTACNISVSLSFLKQNYFNSEIQ